MLVNVAEFRQTKGTIDSIRAVLRTAGIDVDNFLEIREYGGNITKTLSGSRKDLKEANRLLTFTGSLAVDNGTLNYQGISSGRPYLMSPFLSSSRIETGVPEIAGTFINPSFPNFPHGISNNASDGLHTSGSFTFESVYRFDTLKSGSYPTTQSLMRISVTGSDDSASKQGVVFNPPKFKFSQNDIDFAGFRITQDGIKHAQSLLDAVASFLTPTTIKDARAWFDFVIVTLFQSNAAVPGFAKAWQMVLG